LSECASVRQAKVEHDCSEFAGSFEGYDQAFVAEPGTEWNYGSGLDWCGVLLERIEGVKLGEWFEKHLFEPLGIKDITFDIGKRPDMEKRLVGMTGRAPDGTVSERALVIACGSELSRAGEHFPHRNGASFHAGVSHSCAAARV
jgi:CubicO group peptidase (beta-lactamase class C family)